MDTNSKVYAAKAATMCSWLSVLFILRFSRLSMRGISLDNTTFRPPRPERDDDDDDRGR
jgi:hypothetical protein